MDQFYQLLRAIQKKERNNASLARVEEGFYAELQDYVDVLKQEAMNDPFSKAPDILKQAQIIATDICQRREKKITEAAVLNIHRSYHLFTGKPKFDLVDTTPLNLTPEEEKFYYSVIDSLKNHRDNISLEKLSDGADESRNNRIIRPKETQSNTLTPLEDNDEITEKPDEIKKSEPVDEDFPETSQKQIIKPKKEPSVSKPPEEVKVDENPKPQKIRQAPDIEGNPNLIDNRDEFVDFESERIAKESELVTMLVFDDVGAIVGVDEKVYGPFRPQDIVTLPLVNAKIFFKNRKGRRVKI